MLRLCGALGVPLARLPRIAHSTALCLPLVLLCAASGVWHRFDDSLASRIAGWEARSSEKQRECYLLFYTVKP